MGLKGERVASGPLSRREFVSGAIGTVGGFAFFSFPRSAHASPIESFSDSLGRSFDFCFPAESVVPLGVYAQTMMETLCPECLSSLAKEVSSDAEDFAEAGLAEVEALPETGTPSASFGKGVDSSQVSFLSPDIVLQVGFPRDGINEELEHLQDEFDSPCVFLDISFGGLQDAYRQLGKLLGCEQRAGELVGYIDDVQCRVEGCLADVASRKRVFYGPRVAGKKVNEGVAVQVDILRYLGLDPVVTPYNFERKTVDFDSLIEEDPSFVLLDDTSFPDSFFSCEGEVYEDWVGVRAMNEGRFAIAPALMHSVLGSAVFAQSIGMLWIASVVNPGQHQFDLPAEMVRFYDLFYGLKRERDEMSELLGLVAEDE